MIRKILFLFSLVFFVSSGLMAQQEITGKVIDENSEPLMGVNVVIKGTTIGTVTNLDGEFKITAPTDATLQLSFVGYTMEEIVIGVQTHFEVMLLPDLLSLTEVVVTALGIRKEEKTLTYATQTISSEELLKVKQPNFINGLSGKTSGLQITKSSSGLGGASKVVLRGNKSIDGTSQPLYVIDGIPMANYVTTQPDGIFGNRDSGDGLSQINPDDIESITVLKGATAAALYGSQGANGVIIITTKKGQAGVTAIDFSSNITFDSPIEFPEFQWDYGQTATDALGSWGAAGNFDNHVEDFYNTGRTLINSLSITSGKEKMQTYFSYSNTNSTGILPTNEYNKNNLNFRSTSKVLNDKLTLDGNIALTDQKIENTPFMGYYFNPLTGLYLLPRGLDFEDLETNYETFNEERNLMQQNWFVDQDLQQNPYWILNRNRSEDRTKRLIGSLNLKYDLAEGLFIQARGNYDYTHKIFEHKIHATTSNVLAHSSGRYRYENLTHTSMYSDVMANYTKTFSDVWDISAVIGSSYQKQIIGDRIWADSNIKGLHLTNVFSLSNMDTREGIVIESSVQNRLIKQSVFANAQIGYDKKIYLDITGRNDWASSLAFTPNGSYFYPSVGLTTILSEMMTMPDFVSFAKLRASYSVVGNEIPAFLTNPVYKINSITGHQPITTEPYTELKPEKQKNLEFGLDVRLFNGRVNMDVTYYQIDNIDQFILLNSSSASKYDFFRVNAGHIQNKGFEVTLDLVPVKTSELTWNSTLNFSTNKNKIIELHEDLPDGLPITRANGYGLFIKEGGSYGDLYAQGFSKDGDGNIVYDTDGIPERSNDYEKVGNVNPAWFLNWNNSVSYGNFDFSFLIDGKFDYEVISLTEMFLDSYGVSKASADARNNGGVIVPGTNNKVDAQLYYSKVGGNNGTAGEYVYDATNIRLRQASLGYTISLKKFIQKATISLVGNNLFFLYKKAPYDPDITMSAGKGMQGVEFFTLPATRSIGLNLKLTF